MACGLGKQYFAFSNSVILSGIPARDFDFIKSLYFLTQVRIELYAKSFSDKDLIN
jgi:hypothetical protein